MLFDGSGTFGVILSAYFALSQFLKTKNNENVINIGTSTVIGQKTTVGRPRVALLYHFD